MAAPEEEASQFHRDSGLREAISRWIADHPDGDFEEASRMANRFMRKYGYPMVLDASHLLRGNKTKLKLRAGRKLFVFEAGKELSRSPDICGERYLRIPARVIGRNRAALVSNRKSYPFSLKGFRRDRFRVYRGDKLVAVIYAPEPTEPIGLEGDGKALFLKFPLNEEATSEWWQKMATFQPSLLDEDPYLLLRVEQNRLYFDENLEHVPAQEFEVDESDDSSFRWRFLPSGLVLELSSKCS
jgi:hypothetical protein